MRILIYGAGAVGCYIGGHLALAGHTVTLLGREALVDAVQQRGLTLRLDGETITVRTIGGATTLEGAIEQSGPFDWIAFTMKAYDTTSAIHELMSTVPQVPPIVCFQNGVGNEEALQDAFGSEQVIAGTLTTAVSMEQPGIIVEEKQRGIALAAAGLSPNLPTIVAAFDRSRLNLGVYENWRALKWSKLLLNILGNSTSAILDWSPEQVFNHRDIFNLEVDAILEALSIMREQGIQPINLPGSPARLLTQVIRWIPLTVSQPLLKQVVGGGRGKKPPSLLLALRAGSSRTEVAWLNGAVAQAAHHLKLLAPINHALALIVSEIAARQVPWSMYKNRPDMLLTAIRTARGQTRSGH